MITTQKRALATHGIMKQLVDVYNQLGLVADQEIISDRPDSWRLNKAFDYIQDVIGDMEEELDPIS